MIAQSQALGRTRKTLSELISAQTQKRNADIQELYDEEDLTELFTEIKHTSLGTDLDVIKMILFIHAKRLKDQLMNEAFAEAKKRGSFFAFTVNLSWRKDPLNFTAKIVNEPEQSGRPDGIYWCQRKGRKVQGKVVYFYERIVNPKGDFEYPARAFKGARDWELELIIKYEKRFAMIRKLLSGIADIQRRSFAMLKHYEKWIAESGGSDFGSVSEQVPNELLEALN